MALHETHWMTGGTLNAWCREHGVFPHHLTGWQAAFCTDRKAGPQDSKALRALKEDNDRLQREVLRKDKALAEAAALLILQKSSGRSWRTRSNDRAARAPCSDGPGRRSGRRRCAPGRGARQSRSANARCSAGSAAIGCQRACRRRETGSARLNAVSCSLSPTPMSSRACRPARSYRAWSIKGCTWRRSRHSIGC